MHTQRIYQISTKAILSRDIRVLLSPLQFPFVCSLFDNILPNARTTPGMTAPEGLATVFTYQCVPADPRSASVRSRANRSSEKGAISPGGSPSAISLAICSPPAGIALKPHVPQPVVR